MAGLEVQVLLGATPRRAMPLAALRDEAIAIPDGLEEDTFLKTLDEALQQHVALLEQQFLVLSTCQVALLAGRLHDVLIPKRDEDTRLVHAWTIQPTLQLKVKASAHIQVLKLSTILREVQRLRVHESLSLETRSFPIEMDIFPSLKVIESLNLDVMGLQHVHYFARQLRELHIEHTNAIALTQLLTPAETTHVVPWRKLLKLHMNCGNLELVDESVNLLRAVRTMDLSWNKIDTFNSNVTMRSLEVLNLCHNQLRIVPPIQALRGLRELDLAVNQLVSLKGLEILKALERLDISHNLIDDITEVELLTRLPRLAYLKMELNPIARRPDYRREVLFYLGEPIELDGHRWSEPEVSSMKNRRMLVMLDGGQHNFVDSSLWGQSEKAPAYPNIHIQSGTVVESPKIVLGYPRLPQSQAVLADFVDIQNPMSTFPTKSNQSRNAGDGESENGESNLKTRGNTQGSHGVRPSAQTVDEYFRTQCNVIVSQVRKNSQEREDESVDSTTGQTRGLSRTHSTTSFMHDFEEEELLMREGNYTKNADMLVARSTSQTQIPDSQSLGRSFDARVLLSAKVAARLDLHFEIDGVPANVGIKPRKLVERFTVSDGRDPIAITRWLPDVVAVGAALQSNRAKVITMKLRLHGSSSVMDAAYQFDSAVPLETLLSLLVARLFQQYKSHIVICNCVTCGALSLLTAQLQCARGSVRKACCALCKRRNRHPKQHSAGTTAREAITEGFYIEEPPVTGSPTASECIIISCNSIREVTASSVESGRHKVKSDEWNDAIVHAMTTSMR